MTQVTTIVLAAGKGKRMKSNRLKVLHDVGGKSMLAHVLKASTKLKSQQTLVVVPQNFDAIKENVQVSHPKMQVDYAVQTQQKGTGDAVKSALKKTKSKNGVVVVLNGDIPLISALSIQHLVKQHLKTKSAVTLTTLNKDDPGDFGRIVRDINQKIVAIKEFKDANQTEKQIKEINVGIYAFDTQFLLKSIAKLQPKNKQKEYYLTDLVAIALQQKLGISAYILPNANEALGVNSQADLSHINAVFYNNQREKFLQDGVSLLGSEIFIDADVKIKPGARLESPCYLKGQTAIAAGAVIETGCVLDSAMIGENVWIKSHTRIAESKIGKDCQVGPFAHIRPQTELAAEVKVGNFVEIKKTKIGFGSKASHLSYLGDATLGKYVNVGAGTITCNYDGKNKFKTQIKDGVFIGSDTQLVAPVTLGKGAFVAAGTTVTKNVKDYSLVLSRVPQKEKKNWAKKK